MDTNPIKVIFKTIMQTPFENNFSLETEDLEYSNRHESEKINSTISESQSNSKNHTLIQRFWHWTGVPDTTLVKWLQIISSIAVPVILALISHQYAIQQAKDTEENQRSELMSKYYERMQELLLDKHLRDPNNTEARSMGRAVTLSTFRQLDSSRKGELLKFLYDSHLIGGQCQSDSPVTSTNDCVVINLNGAKLEKTSFDLQYIRLPNVDLNWASLEEASLSKIQLTRAKMNHVNLRKANLSGALLEDAQMESALLEGAQLSGALLPRANLQASNLRSADLQHTDLRQAILENADLQNADLRGADLTGASLKGAKLKGAVYDASTKFPEIDPNPGLINPEDAGMIQQ